MRISRLLFALSLIVASTAHAQAAESPDWSLDTANGETIRLSEEVGKQTTVLFFWATWCPYCKALMPHLQSMRIEYGDRIGILAINFGETGDPVAFIRDSGYDFTVLPEGDAVAALYGVHATPGVIIVDRGQAVRFDLRRLPKRDPPTAESPSHRRKAAYRAPYWAAEIRKGIDTALDDSER